MKNPRSSRLILYHSPKDKREAILSSPSSLGLSFALNVDVKKVGVRKIEKNEREKEIGRCSAFAYALQNKIRPRQDALCPE